MQSTSAGAHVAPRFLETLPRLRIPSSLRKATRRALTSPLGIVALSVSAFIIGVQATTTFGEAATRADQMRATLYTQSGQLARLQTQLELSDAENAHLAAVHAFSAEYAIPADLSEAIYGAASAEGLRPELAFKLVQIESGFRRTAIGPAGSVGLAQVKPSTAQWVDPTVTRELLFDVDTNLRVGFRYLSILLQQYADDERLALLAYNRGPGRVGELLALGRDPANGYARRILAAD